MFVIYVNDVSDAFSDGCICKLYADDIKLYSVMRTVNECKNFQESLGALCNWSNTWQLPISYQKCSFMVIGNLKMIKIYLFHFTWVIMIYLAKKVPKILEFTQTAA